MRYAFQVQYIGKNYSGSQIQFENGIPIDSPTIQGELEKALCTLIRSKAANNNRPIRTVFSGRTDKGVNSLGSEMSRIVKSNLMLMKRLLLQSFSIQ